MLINQENQLNNFQKWNENIHIKTAVQKYASSSFSEKIDLSKTTKYVFIVTHFILPIH